MGDYAPRPRRRRGGGPASGTPVSAAARCAAAAGSRAGWTTRRASSARRSRRRETAPAPVERIATHEREPERHGEVQEADADDAARRRARTPASRTRPRRRTARRARAGPVDSVTWRTSSGRPKKRGDHRRHAEQNAERDVAAERRDVALDAAGERLRALGDRASVTSRGRAGDRLRQPPVGRPVLEPAGGDGGQPQQHAGERRVDQRRTERRERLDVAERMLAVRAAASPVAASTSACDQQCRRHDQQQVAGDRRASASGRGSPTSSTNSRSRPRCRATLSFAAIAAAVIAGCLVASVPCRRWIATNDSA